MDKMNVDVERLKETEKSLERKIENLSMLLGYTRDAMYNIITLPRLQALVGKCYVFLDRYSGDEYWPVFIRVTGLHDHYSLLVTQIQVDSYGAIEVSHRVTSPMVEYWTAEGQGMEISRDTFNEEVTRVSRLLNLGGPLDPADRNMDIVKEITNRGKKDRSGPVSKLSRNCAKLLRNCAKLSRTCKKS